MEKDNLDNDIFNSLQEFKQLLKDHQEAKMAQKELTEFVALLQEELKLSRDGEKAAEFNKSRSQIFVNQQQEVILKILNVKEENENLKHTINQMRTTISDIQDNSMSEHVKKDAEIQEMKQDYLKELMKVQEAADDRVMKVKSELATTLDDLRTTLSKRDTTIQEHTATIDSLQAELQSHKERAAANMDTFHKKLAEQERKYQAELETWKMAELNRTSYEQAQVYSAGTNHNTHQPGNMFRPVQEYQYSRSYLEQPPSHSYPVLVSRYRNVLPKPNPDVVRPLPITTDNSTQKNTDFLSASDVYLQNQRLMSISEEANTTERLGENTLQPPLPTMGTKPKIQIPNKKRKLFSTSTNLL